MIVIYSLPVIFRSQVAFDKRGHGLILIRIAIRKIQWLGEGVSSFPVAREKSVPLTALPTPGLGPLWHIWQKLFPRSSSGSSGVGKIAETYGSGKSPPHCSQGGSRQKESEGSLALPALFPSLNITQVVQQNLSKWDHM